MKPKAFAEKLVKEAEEDELRMLAKNRNPRDRQKFVETFGADYLLALLIPNQDERERRKDELMAIFQKQANIERDLRKRREIKEDEARRKATLKRGLEILNELKSRIQIKSRYGAKTYITDDGNLVWECPGTFTDEREQTRKCDVILSMSMVQDELPKRRFFASTTKYQIEAGEGKTREPSIAKLKGKGAAEAVTTMSRGSNAPIIGDITMKGFVEELVVLRCPKCSIADDLKITLKEK